MVTHTHMLDAKRVTETSFGTLRAMLLVQLLPGVGKEMFSGKCLTTMDSPKKGKPPRAVQRWWD